MTITKTEIRPGAYFDSVVLMHLQRSLADLSGVIDAGVVMATPANLELLADGDLMPVEAQAAKSDDLLIVVKGADESQATRAMKMVDELIASRRSTAVQTSFQPRSIQAAVKYLPDARWLVISVPGRYAAAVAQQGLDHDLNVFLYSDNVSIEEEIELKNNAVKKGLLVMGPDCGTAIVNGVGLGFANRVRRGPIGLVGASGTGLQAVTADIHRLGSGVSQALGTGGRDLKEKVGGITALQGIQLLANDPETHVIVLVSKPPDPGVAARLLGAARSTEKPVIVNFIGYPVPATRLGNLYFAENLTAAAELAVQLAQDGEGVAATTAAPFQKRPETGGEAANTWLRGLFSGGTLATEAVLALQNVLFPLYSNVPISEGQRLANPLESQAHSILDLGEDLFTQGRLHPMMDNDLRIRRLRQEAADLEVGLILLDLVLGEGAHPDPASELAPAISGALHNRPDLQVGVIIIGTDEDPQDLQEQGGRLRDAGAVIFPNVQAAADALTAWSTPTLPAVSPIAPDTFRKELAAVNVGLESFYESLRGQGAEAIHVEWRPPAGGNERMMGILAKLKGL